MAILLRHQDVAGLLSTDEVIAAVRGGLVEQAAGQVQVPPRITIDSAIPGKTVCFKKVLSLLADSLTMIIACPPRAW